MAFVCEYNLKSLEKENNEKSKGDFFPFPCSFLHYHILLSTLKPMYIIVMEPVSWSVWFYSKVEHLRYDGEDTSGGGGGAAGWRRSRWAEEEEEEEEEEEHSGRRDDVTRAAAINAACSFLLMVKIKNIIKSLHLVFMSKMKKRKTKNHWYPYFLSLCCFNLLDFCSTQRESDWGEVRGGGGG